MINAYATEQDIKRLTVSCAINEAVHALEDPKLSSADKMAIVGKLCPAGGPVAMCGNNGDVYVIDSDSHSIMFASSGRGKTRRHVFPMVMTEILSGTNLVVNDMKGEIYEAMQGLLKKMGYTVYVLDLRQPSKSPNRYNPLAIAWDEYYLGDKDAAFLYLHSFGQSLFSQMENASADPFWHMTATDYFVALTMGMLEHGVEKNAFTLESVALMDRMGNKKSGPGNPQINDFFAGLPKDGIAEQFASGTIGAPSDTRASILSVFRQPISLYAGQRGLMDVLARDDFKISDLAQEKRAFFIISPDETHSLGPVVVGILNQVMSALISHAQAAYGGVLPRRIDFILDEFGNLPAKVPEMSALVSAARSRNIRFHFVLQSEHQLSNVYGDQIKEVILDNVDNWFFMGSRGLQFLKHVSELAGERENASGKVEPVMSVAKLQRLEKRDDETETLVLMGSLKPFVTPLKDISQYESVDPEGVAPAPRRQIDRSVFDVEAVVRDMKEKKIREIMDREMCEKDKKPTKKHPKKTIDEDILESLRKMAAESAAE